MRKLIFLFFIISLFLVSSVSADMIPAGQKYVKYTFEIENIGDYPEYLFFLYGKPMVNGFPIEVGEELFFYKLASPRIYAIQKDNFNAEEFEEIIKPKNHPLWDNYFSKEHQFIKSDLKLKNYGLVSEFDPLVSAKDILKIAHLSEEGFIVVKDTVVYTYKDGMAEVKEYNTMDPSPSRTTILPSWTMPAVIITAFLLSLVALILMIYLVVRRIRR
jgi:hypothetical protein